MQTLTSHTPPHGWGQFKNIFKKYFDFPDEDVVQKLKQEGKLKPKTKVQIETSFLDDFMGPTVWWNKTVFSKTFTFNVLGGVVGLIGGFIAWLFTGDPWSIYLGFLIGWNVENIRRIIALIRDFFHRRTRHTGGMEILGHLPISDDFYKFLNKFGKRWWIKLDEILLKKILRLFKKSKQWEIEYSILYSAYKLYQEDIERFKEVVETAKNKKELKIFLEVR